MCRIFFAGEVPLPLTPRQEITADLLAALTTVQCYHTLVPHALRLLLALGAKRRKVVKDALQELLAGSPPLGGGNRKLYPPHVPITEGVGRLSQLVGVGMEGGGAADTQQAATVCLQRAVQEFCKTRTLSGVGQPLAVFVEMCARARTSMCFVGAYASVCAEPGLVARRGAFARGGDAAHPAAGGAGAAAGGVRRHSGGPPSPVEGPPPPSLSDSSTCKGRATRLMRKAISR